MTSHTETTFLGPGVLVGGKYRIEQLIGYGGFSYVFRARHDQIHTLKYALKVLKPEQAQNEETRKRFIREAELAGALRSPHTVRVTDYGEMESGTPYLVMDYVDGISLQRGLDHHGPLNERTTGRFARQTLRALAEAHSMGMVHRDLKPANILVASAMGERLPDVRVADFGLAKVLDAGRAGINAWESSGRRVYCSPAYAAPEVLRKQAMSQSDIYSLGHVMCAMLSGHPPYQEKEAYALAALHLSQEPVPLSPPITDSALGDIIAQACAKDPRDRYQNALSMIDAIDVALGAPKREQPDALNASLLVDPDGPAGAPRTMVTTAPTTGSIELVTDDLRRFEMLRESDD